MVIILTSLATKWRTHGRTSFFFFPLPRVSLDTNLPCSHLYWFWLTIVVDSPNKRRNIQGIFFTCNLIKLHGFQSALLLDAYNVASSNRAAWTSCILIRLLHLRIKTSECKRGQSFVSWVIPRHIGSLYSSLLGFLAIRTSADRRHSDIYCYCTEGFTKFVAMARISA